MSGSNITGIAPNSTVISHYQGLAEELQKLKTAVKASYKNIIEIEGENR